MKHKSYNFRLYPTKEQEDLLSRHFGHNRFVFNHFLRMKVNFYQDNKLNDKKSLNYHDTALELTKLKKEEETLWLKEVNSQSLQQTLRHLDNAYNNFFNKRCQFPNFKKKFSTNSFTVPQHIKVDDGRLYIPKFKTGLKMIEHRQLEGDICFATIKKTKCGHYYVSITCEVEIEQLEKTGKEVGIDLGIKDYAIESNGTKHENPKEYIKSQKKLKHEQRQLSKKVKGSNSRNKQRIVVAREYERVSNKRKDFLHKLSTNIVKNQDYIFVEDLSVKNMIKNHNLAKHIQDAYWGTFVSFLEYKCDWYGKTLIKIDRFFPSSKTCNECGWKKEDLTLKDREWECEDCHSIHDRDVNASLNILKQGQNKLKESVLGTNSDLKQKRAEANSLELSMIPEAHPSLAGV